MPDEIIIFQHRNFRGHHRHIYGAELNLNHPEDKSLNDEVSSFIVVIGQWKLYRHSDFNDPYPPTFEIGMYPWVGDFLIDNDEVSSLKSVATVFTGATLLT